MNERIGAVVIDYNCQLATSDHSVLSNAAAW